MLGTLRRREVIIENDLEKSLVFLKLSFYPVDRKLMMASIFFHSLSNFFFPSLPASALPITLMHMYIHACQVTLWRLPSGTGGTDNYFLVLSLNVHASGS